MRVLRSPAGRRLCFLAGLVLLVLGGCAGMRGEAARSREPLPPVSARPSGVWHAGRMVWLDLVTPDIESARTFYQGLFGWTFVARQGFYEVYNHGRMLACVIETNPPEGEDPPGQWLPYLSVPDVEAAARVVTAGGGRIVKGPVDMPRRGRGVLVRDPWGAYIVFLRAREGDPPERRPEQLDWLWVEHWTVEREKAVELYREAGGYEALLEDDEYTVLVNEGRWRAGIRPIREKAFAGRWVPVVRVEDPKALVARVAELGGVVWLEPGQGGAGRDTALIEDSTGALLVLQSWSFDDQGGEP